MKRFFSAFVLSLMAVFVAYSQNQAAYTIRGVVLNKDTGKPVEYATVVLAATEQWAVADANGNFTIQNVQPGKNTISISCLGFVTDTKEIVWLVGAMLFALLVVLPWAVYGVFKLFLLTLYHTRKAWLQAAKDVKER